MTRPHEDLERHTPTDHRPGGVPVTFARGAWCAIDVVHTKAERVDAGISAYETLIEKARSAALGARAAAVLRSTNDRRVIAIVTIPGHETFRHLQSSWDDHHLVAQRHDVAESSTLALYRVAEVIGDPSLDPESTDVYGIQSIAGDAHPQVPGARGVLVFQADSDAKRLLLIYRVGHREDLAELGETVSAVHPVRTFG